MKLAEIQDTLESLDRAFETVEEEVRSAAPGAVVPAWESLVRERPRREPGFTTGDLRCATHGGAPHGIGHDALSDHLAAEFAQWTRLARYSDTVRGALGIERISPSPGARIGVMLHIDGDLELRARIAAAGDSVVPTEAGRWLWARERIENIDFRPPGAKGEAYLFFSADGRRWSFSDVRKGYEDYLLAAGKRPDEAAMDKLFGCPLPKLLGVTSDYNARNQAERAPIVISEAWLWDGGEGEIGGALAGPCEACRFGLSAWLCGHADMLLRGPGANVDYAKRSRQWTDRLRDRKPPKRARASVWLDSDIPPAAKATDTLVSGEGASAFVPATTRVRGAGGGAKIGAPAAGSTPPSAVVAAVLPGAERESVRTQRPRERTRIRLESPVFSCEGVEVREVHGRESMSRLSSFQVDIVCPGGAGRDLSKVLGAAVSLVFEQGPSEVRRVRGMVSEVLDRLDLLERGYRLWIVPRAWRSTLAPAEGGEGETSVPELWAKTMARAGLDSGDVESRLLGRHAVVGNVPKAGETGLAFVSRLTEAAGIGWFVEHGGGSDRVILADDDTGFLPVRGAESVAFRPRGEKVDVFEIQARSRVIGEGRDEGEGRGEGEGSQSAGGLVTSMRYEGRSDRCELSVGRTVVLTGHPLLLKVKLLLVDVEHHARQTGVAEGSPGGDEPYRNTFRAVDARSAIRALRLGRER